MPFFRKNKRILESERYLDGPYIFYEGDLVNVFSLEEENNQKTVGEETFLLSQKEDIYLQCVVDHSIREKFNFKLKDQHIIPESKYGYQEKIFVTSDLEGNFYAFSSLLKSNKVIDKNFNWIFKENHLVIIGDVMDRGIHVTQCLWLIYKLEQEAEKFGGKVHFLLGNHELINMKGITGFVMPKYLELAEMMNLEYYELFSSETELGRWMRNKNTFEIIGDIAFVHAGICPEIVQTELTIDMLNKIIRDDIDGKIGGASLREQLVLGNKGLLWYRGFVRDTDDYFKLTQEEVDKILNYFNVGKVVIGHTKSNEIKSSFEGKVYRTDAVQPKSEKEGNAKALLIENGIFFQVDDHGNKEKLN